VNIPTKVVVTEVLLPIWCWIQMESSMQERNKTDRRVDTRQGAHKD